MDVGAELTLQIICFLQAEEEQPPCTASRWIFVPRLGRGELPYAEAAERLATIEKPVVIGALTHPGMIAVWSPSAIDDTERPHITHTLANQVAVLEGFVDEHRLNDSSLVRFESVGRILDVPARELRRWLGEYALTWGWNLGPPTDTSHQGRLFVLRRWVRWSPGGPSGPRL
jgi:hypothetical protein